MLFRSCEIIINLDHVTEIVPLTAGGCIITLLSSTGKYDLKVKDSYALFRQFAMQTVSAEDIAKVNGRISKDVKKEKPPVSDIMLDIPKL